MAFEYKGKYYNSPQEAMDDDPSVMTDPVFFCEAFLTIPDGEEGIVPFRFDKPEKGEYRNYLFDMYRDTHPRIVVLTGRQVEKTSMCRNKILADMHLNEGLSALFASPRAEQVARFSAERIDNAIRDSQGGVLKDSLLKKGKATSTFKQFDSKCNLFLYSAWADADSIRGISCQRAYLDEQQDITASAREVIEECLAHAHNGGQMSHFGTPKNSGSEFHRLWQLSDMKEWYVECQNPECGHNQKMSMNNIYKPDENKPAYFGCAKCKKELDRSKGKWVSENNDRPKMSGYHITQLMCSWITADSIMYKRATYSEQKFKNEVLGEFHNVFGKTLDLQDIMDCTNATMKLSDKGHKGPNYLGVDWGSGTNSFTVVTIIGPDMVKNPESGKMEEKLVYRYVKKYNESGYGKVLSDIHKLIPAYNIVNTVIDIGDARRQFEELLVEYPDTVAACQYVLALKNPYKWDRKTRIHTCDRSYHIEKVIDMFHKRNIVIPYDKLTVQVTDRLGWLFEHLTSLEAEWVEPSSGNTGYTRYLHSNPDDGFQSLVYAWLAYERRKQKVKSTVRIQTMNWSDMFKE
jgi:hypothetical protein